MTHSSHRRLQWLAIVGALMMLGWNGAPIAPAQTSTSAFGAVAAGPPLFSTLEHDGIVDVLNARNPALGVEKAQRIADAVLRCTRQENLQELTPRLVLSVMFQESNARPNAISPKGAVGLMQVMPYMFDLLKLPGGIAHLETNVEAGCAILADNIRRLGRERGISAYFWGNDIRGDDYLNGVETILRTLSPAPTAPRTPERG